MLFLFLYIELFFNIIFKKSNVVKFLKEIYKKFMIIF